MDTGSALLVVATALAIAGALLCLLLVARLRHQRAELQAALQLRLQTTESEAALIRRVRLAAHDIRGAGMTVHGHADHLTAAEHPSSAGIAVAAADLLDLADDLQDLTLDRTAKRTLREEDLALGLVVDEAIASVSATILPGRRNWRVQPDLRPITLLADRRAVRHAMTRVLADAVRNTRHDDWIDIGGQDLENGFAIVIADEGNGALTPERHAARRDSRGIGMRLALARALVEAHDGRMEVESFAGVGSRVSLVFPAARKLAAVSPPSHSYAEPQQADWSAGR